MLFDHIEHLPALEHLLVIPAILLGKLFRKEIEIGLALEILERGAELCAELVVGKCEAAVDILT